MAKILPKTITEAIYSATKGKSGSNLGLALKRSVKILENKRMIGKSKEVLNALQEIIDKKEGIVRMKAITARKIGHTEQKKLENEMKEKYKAQSIVSEFFEKPELLGGIRVEVGDEILDATYKNKLRQLEKFLIRET